MTGRYDISTRGSLFDALDELQMAIAKDPSIVEQVEDPSRDELPAARRQIQPRPAASSRASSPRQARPTFSTASSAPAPRGTQEVEAPAAAPEPPSVVERIATMPRFRTEDATNHPTGCVWVSPTQRQLSERPPA